MTQMSVEELVKRLRHDYEMGAIGSKGPPILVEAADKLEELAAWNARLDRDLVVWTKKCFDAEAALAEKDKEIAALRDALQLASGRLAWAANTHTDIQKSALLTFWSTEARNAGGNDAE